jgi:DNA primase
MLERDGDQSTAEGGKHMMWVRFADVKRDLDIHKVLAHYELTDGMEERGNNIKVFCPFHGYQSEEPTLSFTVTEDNTKFRCFASGCEASGNGVDFVARLEGLDSFRDAAVLVQERFLRSASPREAERPQRSAPQTPVATKHGHSGSKKSQQASGEGEHGNQPLSWQHEQLDYEHPYLLKTRGFSTDILREFGVGFYPRRGMMHGRVVFPIHNIEGQLIAYVGRWAKDPVPSGKRKYFLPPGIRRGLELYNLHRAIKEGTEAILVEGYFDVLRLYGAGYQCVVSIMGAAITDEQVALLKENFDRVLLLLDGDESGRKATASIAEKLINDLFVRIVTLPEGIDPDHADVATLSRLLGASRRK